MRWIVGTLAVALALGLGGYVAWELMYPAYTHRYRLTIEVSVDGQLRTGSSVYEVTVRRQPQITPEVGARVQLRGEAVFVDLGRTGNLVGLIARGPDGASIDSPIYLAKEVYGVIGAPPDKITEVRGSRILPDHFFPTLASFKDPTDSTSGKLVNPRNLQEIFGPNVAIKRIWIEITSDRPTFGSIAERLPFLRTMDGLTGGKFDKEWTNPALMLTLDHFIRR